MTTWKSAAARRLASAAATTDVMDAIRVITAKLLQDAPCPPTNLEVVSGRLNAKLRPDNILGSGELRRDGKGYEIVYAVDLTIQRRRFTIAHELGHVIIDQTGRNAPQTGKELERLCDLFAVELLMPTQVFLAHLPRALRIADLPALSKIFQTSLSATARRCAELSNVTVFEAAKGKIVWVRGSLRKSTALHDQLLQEYIARGSANESSATVLYLNHDWSIRPVRVEHCRLGEAGRALFLLTKPTPAEIAAR